MRGNDQRPKGQAGHTQNNPPTIADEKRKVQEMMQRAKNFLPDNDRKAKRICEVCVRYDLDPLTGDIAFLPGSDSPYITYRGMTRIANNSGLFDGIEVETVHADYQEGIFIIKAKVYKKGATFPFEDFGDSETKNRQLGKLGKIKIATTRAKCRALRSAFPVALPVEGDPDDEIESVKEIPTVNRDPHHARGPHVDGPSQANKEQGRISEQTQTSHNPPAQSAKPHDASQSNGASQSASRNFSGKPDDWVAAREILGRTMNELQISGKEVRDLSSEMFGRSKSDDLTAKEIESLASVLREERHGATIHQGQLPQIPPDTATIV